MATPIAADHPTPQPPATDPITNASSVARGPKGRALRTITRSGSATATVPPAVSQIDQVDAQARAQNHTDRREHLGRADQPIDQVADPAPDQDAAEEIGADRPPGRQPAPHVGGIRSAAHRAREVYRPNQLVKTFTSPGGAPRARRPRSARRHA